MKVGTLLVNIPAPSGRSIRQSKQERGKVRLAAMPALGRTPRGIYRPEALVLC
jgi:hypothetical protein